MFKTVLTPVHDIDTTKATWTALLGDPTSDTPYYVGWTFDGQEVGLVPNGHQQGMVGPTPYWHVDDIETASGGRRRGRHPEAGSAGRRRRPPRRPRGRLRGQPVRPDPRSFLTLA